MSERLTLREIQTAGRNILKAPSPKRTAAAIRERMAAIDVVMAALTGPHYGTDFYEKLGAEWSRLSAMLDGVTDAAGGRGVIATAGGYVSRSPALEDYAAAEEAWQRDPARAELERRHRQLPASWRLPERQRPQVEPPSIRLDADTPPRVKVLLVRSAFEAITAEAMRYSGDVETGGWLVGHRAFGWHRERTVTDATVAARVRKVGKVDLDDGEFSRMDARLQAHRDRDGDLRGVGDWHTHPAGTGRPSDADLRCQARDLATISDHNVSLTSLIVRRRDGRDSWRNPEITAWITRHARSSFGERMVCEPAILKVA